MAQTAAQKAAAAKQKAADKKLLTQTQALLAKQKAALAKLEAQKVETDKFRAEAAADAEYIVQLKKDLLANDPTLTVDTVTGKIVKKEISGETRDAYALLEAAFKLYGLESLVPTIRGYMEADLGTEQAKLKLKTEKAYQDRFKGNELRRAKGFNVLGEVEYLALENDYSETLSAYGLSDYFGVATDAATRAARQQKMADVMGGNISADEFKERIKTVVTRVNMADTNTKTALKSLYNITDTDLVKYFLNPAEGEEALKRKVTVAEISAASMTAGLGETSLAAAEDLARLGITKAKALEGYENIAAYLPTTEKLSAIYKAEGITYNKTTGEEEEFKGLASAKRKRDRLKEREVSTFSGSSGTSQVSLKTRTAGQI